MSDLDAEIIAVVVAIYIDDSTTECVSQEELAAVKTEMERKVDQLHSQLHYRNTHEKFSRQ